MKGTFGSPPAFTTKQVIVKSGRHTGTWTVITASKGYHVELPQDSQTNGMDDASKTHNFELREADQDEQGNYIDDRNTISIESLGTPYNGSVGGAAAAEALLSDEATTEGAEASATDTASAPDPSDGTTPSASNSNSNSKPLDLTAPVPKPEMEKPRVVLDDPSF